MLEEADVIAVELFAGAGGASEGIARVLPDARRLAVELDPGAAAVWRARHGDRGEVLVQSAADVDWSALGPVDLLWSSPPCQRHSRAGKGEGYDGWPDTTRAIRALSPAMIAIENVRGAPVEAWAEEVRGLGYHARTWELDAADYGVPQHRRRLFVVAVRYGQAPPPPARTHGPPGGLLPAWVSMREALGLPRSQIVERRGHGAARVAVLDHEPAPAVLASDGTHVTVRVEGGGGNPGQGRGAASSVRRERDLTDEPSTTIAARPGGNSLPYVRPAWWHRDGDPDAWRLDQPAPTICTADGQGVGSAAARDAIERVLGRRRLTPGECATLQGFPPEYPWGEDAAVHRYRYIGNAVPPRLAEVVVRQLLGAR